MGRTTHIQAYISPDCPKYKKHASVLKACVEAEVSLPKETAEYFGYEEANLCFLDEKLELKIPKHEWSDEYSQGYEIFIKDLPEGVYKIRFSESW